MTHIFDFIATAHGGMYLYLFSYTLQQPQLHCATNSIGQPKSRLPGLNVPNVQITAWQLGIGLCHLWHPTK